MIYVLLSCYGQTKVMAKGIKSRILDVEHKGFAVRQKIRSLMELEFKRVYFYFQSTCNVWLQTCCSLNNWILLFARNVKNKTKQNKNFLSWHHSSSVGSSVSPTALAFWARNYTFLSLWLFLVLTSWMGIIRTPKQFSYLLCVPSHLPQAGYHFNIDCANTLPEIPTTIVSALRCVQTEYKVNFRGGSMLSCKVDIANKKS